MKKLTKKLTLNRETLRRLNLEEASRVAGAADRTDEPFCVSNAVTCGEVQCLAGIE
ncbi:MAG: hypothetical protein QOF89_4909 [Acidobacteriota bacterium]|jgi:hypothetical protein|nr:hypothetical protein [Acidobacteriota bacterium]